MCITPAGIYKVSFSTRLKSGLLPMACTHSAGLLAGRALLNISPSPSYSPCEVGRVLDSDDKCMVHYQLPSFQVVTSLIVLLFLTSSGCKEYLFSFFFSLCIHLLPGRGLAILKKNKKKKTIGICSELMTKHFQLEYTYDI